MPRAWPRCAPPARSSSARRCPPSLPTSLPARRATRTTSPGPRVDRRVGRQRRWRPAWPRQPSAPRRRAPSSGRPRSAASWASSPPTASSPRTGAKPFAPSLDTIGLFTREVADLPILLRVLCAHHAARRAPPLPPRVGLCRTELWPLAAPESRLAVEHAASELARQGAMVTEVTLPAELGGLEEATRSSWPWRQPPPTGPYENSTSPC